MTPCLLKSCLGLEGGLGGGGQELNALPDCSVVLLMFKLGCPSHTHDSKRRKFELLHMFLKDALEFLRQS